MAFEKRNEFGGLYFNKYKKSDKQPDLTGYIMTVNGEEIKLDGWLGKDKNGNLKVSLKHNTYVKQTEQQTNENLERVKNLVKEVFTDDVPF